MATLATLSPRDGQAAAHKARRECARGCPIRTALNAYSRAIHAADRVLQRDTLRATAPLPEGSAESSAETLEARRAAWDQEYGRRVALANELLAADLLAVPYQPVDVWKHLLGLNSASALNYIRSHAAGPPESWPVVVNAEQVGAYEFNAARALWYAKEGKDGDTGIDYLVRNPSYRILTSAPINWSNAVVCEYTGMDSPRFSQIRQLKR